jgi:4-diphosphocytidyl-2-C-methyl-D-erythritol kinase
MYICITGFPIDLLYMITFPNAKINLGLRVVRKRIDGYHDIETIMYPIGLADALEVVPAADGIFGFSATGIIVEGDAEDNLCVKAFRLMQLKYGLPEVKIHLHKVIPTGAGLGGGSSDAAFALKLLRRIFSIKNCNDDLRQMAAQLGSDCSFFVENIPALAKGRGEDLMKLSIKLKGYHLLLVKPEIEVSTPWAYSKINPSGISLPAVKELSSDVYKWQSLLCNDFEPVVMDEYPHIKQIRNRMLEMGAVYSAMSGSGSAVFGLFNTHPEIHGDEFKNMFVWSQEL